MFKFIWKLTGGRPMKRLDYRFTDRISGKRVFCFEDKFGRKWIAEDGAWSIFRVRIDN